MLFHMSPTRIIYKRWKIIFLFALIFSLASGVVTLFFPLEYRADSQVFLISKSRYGVDPYTVVKSAERVGENIAQVMKTGDFYEKVIAQEGYLIDKTPFENISERELREKWTKTIDASVVYGTGVLNISTYSVDPNQAKQLSAAALAALTNRGWEYVGGDVTIKVVNEPIVTRFPVRPNLLVNMGLGFIIGAGLMIFLVLRKK